MKNNFQESLDESVLLGYGIGTTGSTDGNKRPDSKRRFLCPSYHRARKTKVFWRDDRAEYNTRKGNKPSRSVAVVDSRLFLTREEAQPKPLRFAMAATLRRACIVARPILDPEEHLKLVHRFDPAYAHRLRTLAAADPAALLEAMQDVIGDLDQDGCQEVAALLERAAIAWREGTINQLVAATREV
jgi:hypothetical protein